MELSEKDNEFLKTYDAGKYEHPSVTVDMLIFTTDISGRLEILLIKRKRPPYQNAWALPGGFVNIDEDIDDAARRELEEETGLKNVHLEQLYTFGDVGRDPRTRVISVAYMAMVPRGTLHAKAGDDAADAKWFGVTLFNTSSGTLSFTSECLVEKSKSFPDGIVTYWENIQIAFDHEKIIRTAIERMRGKIYYVPIAFEFIKDKNRFSLYELQKVYESILGKSVDTANFRRYFNSAFIKKGLAEETNEECVEFSRRPSKYYRYIGDERKEM